MPFLALPCRYCPSGFFLLLPFALPFGFCSDSLPHCCYYNSLASLFLFAFASSAFLFLCFGLRSVVLWAWSGFFSVFVATFLWSLFLTALLKRVDWVGLRVCDSGAELSLKFCFATTVQAGVNHHPLHVTLAYAPPLTRGAR